MADDAPSTSVAISSPFKTGIPLDVSADGQLAPRVPGEAESDSDREIVREAKERFRRSETFESVARQRWLDDLKFAEGDYFNQYQWPNEIRRARDVDQRPCLTINKTRQHNLQIINDAKQNKPAIKIHATGGGATSDSARVYNAVTRHIEYVSNAQVAYDKATEFQVKAGLGYIRIITDYEDDLSFAQSPYIKSVADPLTIRLDCDAKEVDKRDSKWGFIFSDMLDDDFRAQFPEYASLVGSQTLDEEFGWKREKFTRLAEYFRIVSTPDVIYELHDPQSGAANVFRESELKGDPKLVERLRAAPGLRKRETKRDVVEWYLIVGQRIVERSIWVGKYIPIIPVVGEETIIEGELDRKGHTRALLDPQRMYNYMSSIAVEYSGLQSKIPWLAPTEAIEGFEDYWNNANTKNFSYLPYNAMGDDGNEIPSPKRAEPPVAMPAALSGMQVAMTEMMMASGQYESDFGQQGNERSAKAINERERQSSTSTFHFVDNLAIAIRFCGLQLIDLIPKLYDGERMISILAEDGTSLEIMIDPTLQVAAATRAKADADAAEQILFNPKVGKYDVQADVGPSWGTRKQETFNALSLILTQAPALTEIIGDLLLQSSEFELAEEAAARLRRMVPAQALGQGPTPSEQQLQQQVTTLAGIVKETMQELAEAKLKLRGKDALRDVDVFKATTERLASLFNVTSGGETKKPFVTREQIGRMLDRTIDEALGQSLDVVFEASEPSLAAAARSGVTNQSLDLAGDEPPLPGAKKAPNGKWYVQDRGGSFAEVQPGGANGSGSGSAI